MFRLLFIILLVGGFLLFVFQELKERAETHVDFSNPEETSLTMPQWTREFILEQKNRFFQKNKGEEMDKRSQVEVEEVYLDDVLPPTAGADWQNFSEPVSDQVDPDAEKLNSGRPEKRELTYEEKLQLLQEAREALARSLEILEQTND